jgi:hypothetical protein
MPKKTPQDWETLERQLYAAGVDPADVKAGARRLLVEARKHHSLARKDVASRMN